ncbi:MAG: hypothetical protein KFF49_04600, partial [Bacteroidales bacterium]|nr:hypothetical protein [Bacteroidales bacterium]
MSIIRYIIVFLLPVFLIVQLCNAQAGHPGNEIKPLSSLKLISENDEGLSLLYYSGTGRFETLEPAEGSFVRLMLPDHAFSSNPGKPQLPVLTRLIDYDRIKNTGIRITNVVSTRISLKEYGDAGRIYPCQPGRPKTELTQDHPLLIDKSVYNAGEAFITDTVSVRKIGIMRGKSLGALEINPVTYHPAEEYVDIIVSMNIFIEYAQEKHGHSALKGSEEYYFNQLLSKGLINYRSDDVIPAFSSGPTGMIIVSDTSLKNDLRPLVEWKTRKGFSVTELYIGENGLERDFYDIKDSLTAIYNSSTENKPAPAYLLLAGDLNYIPASGGTSYLTDLYYAEFDGNGDYIPDMFTGRLPARNKSQLRAMVQKIIEYESFLFGDSISHFRKAVALTGLDEGHVRYMDGQVNYAAGYFNINPYPTEAYVFNHESNDSIRGVRYDSLKLMMKAGVGYINYTGHGSATAWQDTGIDHTFITGMSNKSRYPLVISNACLTANFSNSNNLGSVMVRSADKGALAFIGCTNDSYWLEDYYWSVGVGPLLSNPEYDETGLGFYDRLFHLKGEKPSDWYTTSGQILYAGNLAVASSTSPRVQYYWENYVLLGDPSLSPFIGAPEAITASVPDSLPPGLKTLNISTSAFAYAGLSHFDTLWDAGHASPSGSISLDIPGVEKDSCLLIISGQNGEPFIRTLYFAESDTAWMNINDVDISDLTGNDNGLADYNETIALKVSMQNAGNEDADNAYLIIS